MYPLNYELICFKIGTIVFFRKIFGKSFRYFQPLYHFVMNNCHKNNILVPKVALTCASLKRKGKMQAAKIILVFAALFLAASGMKKYL